MSEEQGQCGVCGLMGPLTIVQKHFMDSHVDKNNDTDEEEPPRLKNRELTESEVTDDINGPSDNNNETDEGTGLIRWPAQHILLLIRTIENYQEMFTQTLKKNVWIKIAAEISKRTNCNYTPSQIDNKWKGLKKTYKKIKDHSNKSGNDAHHTWEFYNAMDSVLGKKPEVTPAAVCSSQSGLKINDIEPSTSDSNSASSSSGSSGCNSTIMKKRRQADNAIQKRHDEEMARYDEFLKLYKLSVEHQLGKPLD